MQLPRKDPDQEIQMDSQMTEMIEQAIRGGKRCKHNASRMFSEMHGQPRSRQCMFIMFIVAKRVQLYLQCCAMLYLQSSSVDIDHRLSSFIRPGPGAGFGGFGSGFGGGSPNEIDASSSQIITTSPPRQLWWWF